MKINEKSLLVILIVLLVAVNFNFLNNLLIENFDSRKAVFVERVIDGDTVVINGTSVRMLGINSPERGEKYFDEATEFLEGLVMGEVIYIERYGKDKYYRDLGYLFLMNEENVNVKMVEEGYANYYFYSGRDLYSDELEEAWEMCILKEVNLCERSEDVCSNCVEISSESFIVNGCGFVCDVEGWEMSVEGRDNFVFEGVLGLGEKKSFNLSLDDSGGSLFLRDDLGKLVLWGRSGY